MTMTTVKVFFLDVWQDLQQKRMVPVAAVLALSMVAVPMLLRSPAASPGAIDTPVPNAQEAIDTRPLVTVTALRENSRLETFEATDPFRPLEQLPRSGGGSDSSAGDDGSTSGAGAAPGAAVSAVSPGSGSGATKGGGGTPGAGTPGGGATTTPSDTIFYTYTVDVVVTANGSKKVHKDVERLGLLPSEEAPLFVFLGASTSGKTALFLVDDTLTQSGEGQCKPDGESCTFLYLQDNPENDTHTFEDPDGEKYELRVIDIEQKQVDPAATSAATTSLRPIGAFLFPLVDGQSR